jgi:anti-anti-sigma factor
MATPPETLVIELAGLSFMDSSGIALLVEIAGAVGTFLLRDVSDVIRGVIEATGLSEILRIES